MNRYNNKRKMTRSGSGKFRKLVPSDFVIGKPCETCNSITIRHYNGNPSDNNPDPRLISYRCFNCEPLTEDEKRIQAEYEENKPRTVSMLGLFNDIEDKYND